MAHPRPVLQRPSHGLYLHLAGKEALQVLTANHTGGPSCFCITLTVPGLGGEQAACGQRSSWRLQASCSTPP